MKLLDVNRKLGPADMPTQCSYLFTKPVGACAEPLVWVLFPGRLGFCQKHRDEDNIVFELPVWQQAFSSGRAWWVKVG